MLFNSYGFVFLFFPLVLAGLALCRGLEKKFRCGESPERFYLLAASLVFYGWLHPEYLPVLIGSMAVNYGIGRRLANSKAGGGRGACKEPGGAEAERGKADRLRKWILTAGLVFNLGLLGVFKYMDTGGFVPLGISFFTFAQIAYLMECYRMNLKDVTALSYGLYVSFFPKMMQGPIALPGEFLAGLKEKKRSFDWEQVCRNLFLFILGLSKKALLADTLGKAADFGYSNLAALNSGDGLIVMLSYTLQLYFDFSGYCDMAMGIAGMMGYELPLNFDSPYKASNILEFWKRWHMTLTGFFTKYLYIPLGGNRKGKARTYINCLIVFFLSGVWHGAGWQFIVWGMMHGLLFVATRAWKEAGKKADKNPGKAADKGAGKNPACRALGTLATFLYVNFAWIFFRAGSVKEAVSLIKTIARFSFGRINRELAGCFNLDEFWYVIKVLRLDSWQYAHYILMVLFLTAALMMVFFGKSAVRFVKEVKPGIAWALVMAVLFIWSVISFSGVSTFLYVNF